MPSYPYLELTVSIGSWSGGGEALPDTGCSLGVVIPEELAEEITAESTPRLLEVADGRRLLVPSWPASVEIDGESFRTEAVALSSEFLLGREVLDQLEICFVFGREVRLKFQEA